jgi:predicted ATPase
MLFLIICQTECEAHISYFMKLWIVLVHFGHQNCPFMDMVLPPVISLVNEFMMAHLVGKLLQVLSLKRTPIVFFFDVVQWADPLSLALPTALVKGAGPDLLQILLANVSKHSGSETVQQEDDKPHIMFVGSYCDNEVHEKHLLATVICKFQSDTSINMTTISLAGISFDTLNELLSESLCVPV